MGLKDCSYTVRWQAEINYHSVRLGSAKFCPLASRDEQSLCAFEVGQVLFEVEVDREISGCQEI